MNILSRFLFVALAAMLATATAACGGVDNDAEFANATEEEAKLAIDMASQGAGVAAVFVFALAAADPEAGCPRIETDGDRTTLVGDGCVLDGTTFSGRAVGTNAPTLAEIFSDIERSGPVSYDFQEFALTDEEGVLAFDGEVELSDLANEDSGEIVSKLVVTTDDEDIALDHRFACTGESCTQSGTIEMTSLGGFTLTGAVEEETGSLTLEGADVLTVELVTEQCVPYQVDGANAGTYCPDSAEDSFTDLALPVRASLSRSFPLLR